MAEQCIINADCMDAMADMDENSIHAVVTDPPYGLNFMPGTTNGWDDFEPKEYQEWCQEWATEVLRVLKPGGHLIAFSGNRTEHRLKTGVEDAGFEIRDTITYHYGTGFPKGSDVGKHIDRYHDAEDEREVVENKYADRQTAAEGTNAYGDFKAGHEKTAPATSEAEKWDGWRTQLKPSTEFAVLARAPMSESAVYRNVLEHGTGALNIDRTRIPSDGSHKRPYQPTNNDRDVYGEQSGFEPTNAEGRYPANLLLDGVAARMLDEQSGTLESGELDYSKHADNNNQDKYGTFSGGGERNESYYGDSGGASRFFYTAKASKSERTIDGQVDNDHPTVKPLDLMEYLVTLVTAPGQRVLDPFAGSGTTIMACRRLNRDGIGIEQDPGHADLARKRVELAHDIETDHTPNPDQPPESQTVETDGGDVTLDSFGDN